MRSFIITASLIAMAAVAWVAEPGREGEVTVTIHDNNGFSPDSAPDQVQEIILSKGQSHIHFKITNPTDHGVVLWQPFCPPGDGAMKIEFREIGVPGKVHEAHTTRGYTAGMGFPKVFTLAAGDDMIVNVDFLEFWKLPVQLKANQVREMEMRAVYRSAPPEDHKLFNPYRTKKMDQVWTGEATSSWQRVRIINQAEATVGSRE